MIGVPGNVGPWLWGWPNRFLARMRSVGSEVYAFNRYCGEGFSSALNSAADLEQLPADHRGGIWTDRIDVLAELYEQGSEEGRFSSSNSKLR